MQLHNSDTCRTHRHHIVHRYVASSVLQSARDVPGGGKSYLCAGDDAEIRGCHVKADIVAGVFDHGSVQASLGHYGLGQCNATLEETFIRICHNAQNASLASNHVGGTDGEIGHVVSVANLEREAV